MEKRGEIFSSTIITLVKHFETPYKIFRVGGYGSVEYWSNKLGKSVNNFIMDLESGFLDEWFKIG